MKKKIMKLIDFLCAGIYVALCILTFVTKQANYINLGLAYLTVALALLLLGPHLPDKSTEDEDQ